VTHDPRITLLSDFRIVMKNGAMDKLIVTHEEEKRMVGPMLARARGINIGYYNTTAYEGIVKTSRATFEIGRRYYFQPRYCMLQWRHCGLVNSIGKTPDGLRVRIEGLWIG
jgi:hypothetical protein